MPLSPMRGSETLMRLVVPLVVCMVLAGCTDGAGSDGGDGADGGGTDRGRPDVLLQVGKATGYRDDTSEPALQDLDLEFMLQNGSGDMDLGEATLNVRMESHDVDLTLATRSQGGTFSAQAVTDPDSSYSAADPIVTSDDVIRIRIDLEANGIAMEPCTKATFILEPDERLPDNWFRNRKTIVTPPSYGSQTEFELEGPQPCGSVT